MKAVEHTLETCGKLLRKRLEPFFASKRAADALTFKGVFRKAHHRGLLDKEQTKRWECYRDKRNATSHEYGEIVAQGVLETIELFIQDVKSLQIAIEHE